MGKIKDKKWINLSKSTFFLFIIGFGIFVIFYVILHFLIKTDKDWNNFSIIWDIFALCFIVLTSLIHYYNGPKYDNGLYKWKDGRVYQGEWNNFFGANGKGKLTWSDGSYYEGEFKNGKLSGKGKKVCPNGESSEGEWKDNKANGKGKSIWAGLSYEGEFKNGKPHGMGIIKMKNGYYYQGEFRDGKRTGKFKKQVLTTGGIIEGEFKNGNGGFDGIGKVIISNGFTFEGIFKDGKLNGEGKMTTPEGKIFVGAFDNGEFKKGKEILKNGEYSEGNWINGKLNGLARYYFKDGSYYEGECRQGNWNGIGTYITEKGDKYTTEFPYEIINVFICWFLKTQNEINGNLKYLPKSEKQKEEDKNMYMKIIKNGTLIQREIAKIFLESAIKDEAFFESLKKDKSIQNAISLYLREQEFLSKEREDMKRISKKHHIKQSNKRSYSYGEFFNKIDCSYGYSLEILDCMIKIYKFLNPEPVLDFVIDREGKEKERIYLIGEFSDKYEVYIQACLNWREYEEKFWNHHLKKAENE